MRSTLPACACSAELRDQDGVIGDRQLCCTSFYQRRDNGACSPHAPWSFELQAHPC